MIRRETVVMRVSGIVIADLDDWIARGWIAPGGAPPDWLFAETDVARVQLVRDLRDEAGIADDTLPVVLSLLDQVYDLRHALRTLLRAVGELPDETRTDLLGRLRR